jgi:hypothetical protein
MAYTPGNQKKIIVGAAAMFVSKTSEFSPSTTLPDFVVGESYTTTLSDANPTPVRNIGFTMNGLELQFQPDFGEVRVDQFLDVAKLYKQGMQVNLNTAFAEATLENLLVAIAASSSDYDPLEIIDSPNDLVGTKAKASLINLSAGKIGECPVERGLIAVGPGTGDCDANQYVERIYLAYRALSIENVTVSAKRDEASMFEVSFRLLPDGTSSSYGRIIDRTVNTTSIA